MCILVVDDCDDSRSFIQAVLVKGGYQNVVLVETAHAAFTTLGLERSLAPAAPVDMLLLDILLPDVDGIRVCELVRRDLRYSATPIVMTTLIDDIEVVDRAFAVGATDYITKPFKVVDLLACVRSKLRLRAELAARDMRERALMSHSYLPI